MNMFCYPASLEAGHLSDRVLIQFPDIPEADTVGRNMAQAMEEAQENLGLALLYYLHMGRKLPSASNGAPSIAPTSALTAKLQVLHFADQSNVLAEDLAVAMCVPVAQVHQLLDPLHPTGIDLLARALSAFNTLRRMPENADVVESMERVKGIEPSS